MTAVLEWVSWICRISCIIASDGAKNAVELSGTGAVLRETNVSNADRSDEAGTAGLATAVGCTCGAVTLVLTSFERWIRKAAVDGMNEGILASE
jgi:hypothetical protein